MVGVTKIQRQNANYWIEAVAGGVEDYYTKPGEAPGRWLGEAAAEFGLSGEIDRAAYAAALAGRDPRNGEALVHRPAPRTFTDKAGRTRHAEPVLGFDVRFSAPKSVSLLYAIGSPAVRDAATRAHDDAAAEAITHLERVACFVARGHGGAQIEAGRGFLAMAFRHRTSRAGDPALHTHVLVANLTRAERDGRWLSLASPRRRSPLFQQAKAAGHVYQAALRANITRELGLRWHAPHNGHADLEAFDRAVIEHFSQRRAEIEQALAESGNDSPKAAEVAAYRTRQDKDYGVDPESRREDWLARAAEFSLTPASIEAELAGAERRSPRPIGAADLDAALSSLEAGRSHFDRRDLLCAIANQLPEGAARAELNGALDQLLASDRVVEIHRGAGPLDPTYFTTPRLRALERRFIELARGEGANLVSGATLEAVLDRHPYLGAEQLEMIRRLGAGPERVLAVAARPGTGKTIALAAAREAWERSGQTVIGVAAARSAAGELADAGIASTSITALLIRTAEWEARGAEPLSPGTVIVCDEASTASTAQLTALAELASACGGRLVCVGDPRQIGAVGPGGLFAHLTRTAEPIQLTEIRRQRDPADRRVVELAHEGRGSDALDLLRSGERLRITDTRPQALDALVVDWHRRISSGEDAVMIARRTRDVAELNERAKQLLDAERSPGHSWLQVAGREVTAGDMVITRLNSSQVSNRERWRVTGVDERGGALELERVGAERRAVRLDAEYLSARTARGEPALQHGFALTAYASEAKTFDSAFLYLDPGAGREEFLVGISRARGQTFVYGVAANELADPELGPATRPLEDPAHELRTAAERTAAELTAFEISERERISALPLTELARRRRASPRRARTGTTARPALRSRSRRPLDSRHARRRAGADSAGADRGAPRAAHPPRGGRGGPRAQRAGYEQTRCGPPRPPADRPLESGCSGASRLPLGSPGSGLRTQSARSGAPRSAPGAGATPGRKRARRGPLGPGARAECRCRAQPDLSGNRLVLRAATRA